jgi:23S rRNA (cytosine1962-C5)-methyltransferase
MQAHWPNGTIAFYNRLVKVLKHKGKIAKRTNTTCYRLYDKDLPENPLVIDIYAQDVVVYEYESNHNLNEDEYNEWFQNSLEAITEVLQVSPANLHIKTRRRKKDRQDQYQKIAEQTTYKTVEENGHKFLVNFTDFLDTGLFLDHRPTRKLVQQKSLGKKVLNLFCYTSSFSIYAAKGGATEVWSYDLSNTYINWSKDNSQLNKCEPATKMVFKKCDVLAEAHLLPKAYFDIIVVDPPTFSNSKSMSNYWDVQEHHVELLLTLRKALREQGCIYFSTNATKFILDTYIEKYFTIKDITKATTDFDFEGKLRRWCYLLEIKG